jgi:hypothetical protein
MSQSVDDGPCLHVTGATVPYVVGFPRDEIIPPTLKVVAGAKFEIPTLFPVNTVKDVPELFARTITFDPRVLGPIVAPVKTPRVPVVA